VAWCTIGFLLLLGLSFLCVPHWVPEWVEAIRRMPETTPVVTRLGGFLILFVLLRWKRPEAWLIAVLACVPQTPAFYSTLPVFTVPVNFTESVILAGTRLIGEGLAARFIYLPKSLTELNSFMGAIQVATIYLPAVIFILRRENEPPMPAWLESLLRLKRNS
jgi:hypothetical protein